MNLSVSVELQKLNEAVRRYQELSGRTMGETLSKQGGKLAFNLSAGLKNLEPKKGSIRDQAEERFLAGRGLKVSERTKRRVLAKYSVRTDVKTGRQFGIEKALKKSTRLIYGPGLWRKMIESELGSREKGRGFLGVSAKFPREIKPGTTSAKSKFGPILSKAGLSVKTRDARLEFMWGPGSELSAKAAEGLSQPKAQSVIASALSATTADIQTYIDRKTGGDIRKAGLN